MVSIHLNELSDCDEFTYTCLYLTIKGAYQSLLKQIIMYLNNERQSFESERKSQYTILKRTVSECSDGYNVTVVFNLPFVQIKCTLLEYFNNDDWDEMMTSMSMGENDDTRRLDYHDRCEYIFFLSFFLLS